MSIFDAAEKALQPAPKAAETWLDGTPKGASVIKDANGHPVDLERGRADFPYYKANSVAILAERRRVIDEGIRIAEEDALATRKKLVLERTAAKRAAAAAEQTKREEAQRVADEAEYQRKWGGE